MDYGYARMSSTVRHLEWQMDLLRRHGIPNERIFMDGRPGLVEERHRAAAELAAGDTLVVATLDRIGTNLRDCLFQVGELHARNIGVRTLADPIPIDTSSDGGRGAEITAAALGMLSTMDQVYARERAALASVVAGETGRQQGRPRKLTEAAVSAFLAAVASGMNPEEAGQLHGISRSTAYRLVREAKDAAPAGAGEK